MKQPREFNRFTKWRKNDWVAGRLDGRPPIGSVAQAVFVVDAAIKRMMEKNNGL